MWPARERKDALAMVAGQPVEIYWSSTSRRGFLGFETELVVAFVMGGAATGLLGEIGRDCWLAVKKATRLLLGAWRTQRSTSRRLLILTRRDASTWIQAEVPIESEGVLDDVFVALREAIHEARRHRAHGEETLIRGVQVAIIDDGQRVEMLLQYERLKRG
jgi:allophanate hydrolase subunit 2